VPVLIVGVSSNKIILSCARNFHFFPVIPTMMDKQVEDLGNKCIEMTLALYNSDISTHIKIDINSSRLTVRVSKMSLTPQIL